MRKIQIKLSSYHDMYIRKASEDGSVVEIQGQYGGIIVKRPEVRRTLRHGVVLIDHDERRRGIYSFNDRSSGFEKNEYTIENYWA